MTRGCGTEPGAPLLCATRSGSHQGAWLRDLSREKRLPKLLENVGPFWRAAARPAPKHETGNPFQKSCLFYYNLWIFLLFL